MILEINDHFSLISRKIKKGSRQFFNGQHKIDYCKTPLTLKTSNLPWRTQTHLRKSALKYWFRAETRQRRSSWKDSHKRMSAKVECVTGNVCVLWHCRTRSAVNCLKLSTVLVNIDRCQNHFINKNGSWFPACHVSPAWEFSASYADLLEFNGLLVFGERL